MLAMAADYISSPPLVELELDPPFDEPCWHIATVAPNHEGIVAAHIAGHDWRGGQGWSLFGKRGHICGFCLPQYPPVDGRPGRPLFPGYLFVYVRPDQVSLVTNIVGVTGMLLSDGKPLVVRRDVITWVKLIEQKQWLGKRAARRKGYRTERIEEYMSGDSEIVAIRPYDALHAWGMIERLDDNARNGLLRKALGLDVVTGATV